MSLAGAPVSREDRRGGPAEQNARRRIRQRALLLCVVALAFYLGFIALTIYRSRH